MPEDWKPPTLVCHYVAVIGLIEETILGQLPRYLGHGRRLPNDKVLEIATRLAQGHAIASAAEAHP